MNRVALRIFIVSLVGCIWFNALGAVKISYGTYTGGVSQKIDKYGSNISFSFDEKQRKITTSWVNYQTHVFSLVLTNQASWVRNFKIGLTPDSMGSYLGIFSSSTITKTIWNSAGPKNISVSGAFSICPTISATIEENNTSEDRACFIDLRENITYRYYAGYGPNSTSVVTWRYWFIQEAGSKTVTVTLDSNGGTDAMPNKVYKYTNGSSYQQYSNWPTWVWPTTTRAGFVFDAWYTYSPDFPEVHNVRIDENTKTTARVTTIVAHWLFEAPHNFAATSNLTDKIALSWEPVADLNATYGIYRSEDETCPVTPIWSGRTQSFDDMTATPGVSYNYWVKATGTDNGLTINSSDCELAVGMREMEQVAEPTISPADGASFYGANATVVLSCITDGAVIHYTTDGSDPSDASPLYGGPFVLTDTTTVKAIACKDGMSASGIVAATITKVLPLSLNEALDTELAISTGGAGEWVGVRDALAKEGGGYARSGEIGNRQSAWLSVRVSGKGKFSFWWRVSCEADEYGEFDCDAAVFTGAGADVAELQRDGIMAEWEYVEAIFAEEGEHTLSWTYRKDKNGADGDDCLYLDGFSWTPAAESDLPSEVTASTPVPVRCDWLAKYPGILAAVGNDYEAAAMSPTGKKDARGNALSVWHDYVAGTDPTNINSRFAAKVSFKGGKPVVSWEPDLNDGGAKSERFYKVFGKRSLSQSENWTRLVDGDATDGYSFFKVSVGMEDGEDTEDELAFGNGEGVNDESGAEGDAGGDDSGVGEDEAYVPPIVTTSSGSEGAWVYWTAVASATGYEVYRAEKNEAAAATMIAYVESKGVGVGGWYLDYKEEDSSFIIGKMYYYWIKTVYAGGKSDFSEGVTGGAEPPAPQNISASLNRTDGVEITWDAVEVADAYNVYRNDELLGSTTDTRWLDTTVQPNVLSSYDVKSVSATGETSGLRFIAGFRERSIASLVMTGTDEVTIDPQSGATLSFQCEVTYIDGTTETISPDSWDWSEFSGEIWREAGVLYVRLGNGFPSANLTMRATYISNAGGDNPTVYNLTHTVIVHSAQ